MASKMTSDLEQPTGRPSLERQHSVTMEYFIETSNLDPATAGLLRKYDKDGNGSFSKDEVVAIIMDLRQANQHNESLGEYNKLFKRLLIAALCFCVLLLTSMFGLSYAVAALTAKTEVDASGALRSTGESHVIVSTNSRAELHVVDRNDDGNLCVSRDEIDIMLDEIESGRNVILETNLDGEQNASQVSGFGFTASDGLVCFGAEDGSGQKLCWVQGGPCNENNSSGRRLSAEDREDMGLRPRRRLGVPFGIIQESCEGPCPSPAPTAAPQARF